MHGENGETSASPDMRTDYCVDGCDIYTRGVHVAGQIKEVSHSRFTKACWRSISTHSSPGNAEKKLGKQHLCVFPVPREPYVTEQCPL